MHSIASSVVRKSSGHSLDSDEFKQLAYNKVIPQVNSEAISR